MVSDRCGYTADVRGDPDRGSVTCWRPTAGDADRCVWHRTDEKSVADLSPPEPGERLDGAVLSGLDLRRLGSLAETVLIGADFTNANVSGVDFAEADLRNADFRYATAQGTTFAEANLESADVNDADLRGADLRMAKLDDADLGRSRITHETLFGDRVVYEVEMKEQTAPADREKALEAAVRTYRALEQISQNNSLYTQASEFYRKSKDVRRQFNWEENNRFEALVAEASRLFAGYGNRPWRVIMTSIGVILAMGILYPLIGGIHRASPSVETVYAIRDLGDLSLDRVGIVLLRSVFFSVVTFTTLGYGNLEPVSSVGRYVAGLEALLGSVLMALLVAVLTRSTWLR